MPFAELVAENGRYIFYFNKISLSLSQEYSQLNTIPVIILLCTIAMLLLISIFLYKKRILQIRLCVFNIVLNVGLIGMIVFYSKIAANAVHAEIEFKIASVLPLITSILLILAIRAIGKDEALVRSINRIR